MFGLYSDRTEAGFKSIGSWIKQWSYRKLQYWWNMFDNKTFWLCKILLLLFLTPQFTLQFGNIPVLTVILSAIKNSTCRSMTPDNGESATDKAPRSTWQMEWCSKSLAWTSRFCFLRTGRRTETSGCTVACSRNALKVLSSGLMSSIPGCCNIVECWKVFMISGGIGKNVSQITWKRRGTMTIGRTSMTCIQKHWELRGGSSASECKRFLRFW